MLFKTCLFMVKVFASDGPGSSRILVFSVLFKTCALLVCYQWCAYIILSYHCVVLFPLRYYHVIFLLKLSLLCLRSLLHLADGSGPMMNKYSEDVAVLLLILLYWCS